jgi:hypothetical protein
MRWYHFGIQLTMDGISPARHSNENPLHPSIEIVRLFYYWITARAEPVIYRFVR